VDDERPFRLRPRRPRFVRDESKLWAREFQQLMHVVQMTAKPLTSRLTSGSRITGSHTAKHNQRCAVRLMYTKNQIRGQWAAHGRHLIRDSATALRPDGAASFGSAREPAQIPEVVAEWQSGDERLFNLIISPEFGERLDLERLTRDIMTAVESDVGRPLQWRVQALFIEATKHLEPCQMCAARHGLTLARLVGVSPDE
jgi:hypothetical protein